VVLIALLLPRLLTTSWASRNAVTAVSPSLLPEELEDARIQVAIMGIPYQVVQTHEMDNPITQRTQLTDAISVKNTTLDTLKPLTQLGYPYVVDGVNADDLRDYRPGIQAAKERGCDHPSGSGCY